jgi:hypothetical protein
MAVRPWRLRRWGRVLATLAALYLVLAYLLLPDIWASYERQPGLAGRPMVTTTTAGIPGDPINVGLVGARDLVMRAMLAAGWRPADPITWRSSVEIGLSVVLDRPYPDAPVSTLLYAGRPQDLAFEKPVGGSADQRHHVRFWRVLEQVAEGQPLFLGAVSFDRSVGTSRYTGQITHHIGPDLDAERDALIAALVEARYVSRTYRVPGSGPTLNGRNGGGDRYVTDGEVLIGALQAPPTPGATMPDEPVPAPEPWWRSIRHRLWAGLRAIARAAAGT